MPDATSSDITIAQSACLYAGLSQIASFDEGSVVAQALNARYEDIVEDCLSKAPWNFATGYKEATYKSQTPLSQWDGAFTLPTNPKLIAIETVLIVDSIVPYDWFEDMIFVNAGSDDTVIVKGQYRVETEKWPAYFRNYVAYRCAAMLASVVVRKADIIAALAQQAGISLAEARHTDARQVTPQRIISKRFHSARAGGPVGYV